MLVVRNPYSWCHRAIRRKPPSFRVELPANEQLRLVAEHWSNSYRVALDDAARVGNLTVVRFEDFVADPATTVRRLCEFLGLEFERTMVPAPRQKLPFATLPGDRKWYPLFADSWLAHVSEQEAAIVEARCGPLAQELGYRWDGGRTAAARSVA